MSKGKCLRIEVEPNRFHLTYFISSLSTQFGTGKIGKLEKQKGKTRQEESKL